VPEADFSTSSQDSFVGGLLAHLPVGILIYRVVDADDPGALRLLQANEAAGRLLGTDPALFIDRTIREMTPALLETPVPRLLLDAARSDGVVDIDEVEYEDDRIRHGIYRGRAFPLPDQCVGVVFEDVTEQVEMQRAYERQAFRFRAIFDATFQFIGLLRPDGTLLEANSTALDFAGLEQEDVIGKPFWECHWWTHSEKVQRELKEAVRLAASGEFVRYNVQVRGRGDQRATIDFSLKPVFSGDRVTLLLPEGRDVSDLVSAQQAIKRLQQRTERILNSAGEGIVGIGQSGLVTFANEAAGSLLGPRPDSLTGRPHHEVLKHIDEDGKRPSVLPVDRVLARERTRRVWNAWFVRDDGEPFPVEYIVTPLRESGRTGAVVVFRDVSERFEAERALRISEARHRAVIEAMNEGVVLQDASGTILASNQAAQRILGLTEETITGKTSMDPDWNVVDADGNPLPGDRHPAMVALRTGEPVVNFVQGVTRPTGEVAWILVNSSPILNEQGEVEAVATTFTDVSEERRTEEVLRASEDRQRTLLSTLEEGVVLLSPTGGVLMANPAAERMLEFEENEPPALFRRRRTVFRDDGTPFAPEDLPHVRAMRTGRTQRGVIAGIQHADGEILWVSVNAQPVASNSDPDGSAGVVLSLTDITEQRAAEHELRENERQLRSAQQIANLGGWRYDMVEDRISWSDELFRIFGFDPGTFEPTLATYLERIHPEDQEGMQDVINEAIAERKPYEIVHRIVRPSGEIRYLHGRGEPVMDMQGNVVGLQGTGQDITEQQRARDALQRYARELEESNAELEQFAYVASHDLQEPLRMVSSFLQLLQRRYADQLDDTADEYIRYAVDGAKRMQRLIQDLLAYSRVGTRGKPFQRIDLNITVDEVLEDLQAAIQESGAEIIVDPLPTLEADPTQMRQLLQNLVGNALKFRADGQPVVRVSGKRVKDDGRTAWRIAVQDNGIGIAEEHSDRIFQIFQRLHTRDEYAGTGIGLAICRKIVERHGGRIWLDSNLGRGTTFYFTIPVRRDRLDDASI
jgi:PAS domain S-box-containing protein